mmetsp:Transcript_23256/g.69069  ORF Transcript_23256/g.69069 Transcript_23256/m.69069 type:complete len:183 (-) Transcript_23256:1615-2163(-)
MDLNATSSFRASHSCDIVSPAAKQTLMAEQAAHLVLPPRSQQRLGKACCGLRRKRREFSVACRHRRPRQQSDQQQRCRWKACRGWQRLQSSSVAYDEWPQQSACGFALWCRDPRPSPTFLASLSPIFDRMRCTRSANLEAPCATPASLCDHTQSTAWACAGLLPAFDFRPAFKFMRLLGRFM